MKKTFAAFYFLIIQFFAFKLYNSTLYMAVQKHTEVVNKYVGDRWQAPGSSKSPTHRSLS